MATKTLKYISARMKDLDICMMSTAGAAGRVSTRPMSNNRDVKYDGNSFFFSDADTQKVKDITSHKTTTLSFMGKGGIFIIVTGKATIIKSRAIMEDHWTDSLNGWFENGLDTAGLVMISVKAVKIHYWDKAGEGEIKVKS